MTMVELNCQNAQADAKYSKRTYDSVINGFMNFVKAYPDIKITRNSFTRMSNQGFSVFIPSHACYYFESMKSCKCS
jgi:hypothetical protein